MLGMSKSVKRKQNRRTKYVRRGIAYAENKLGRKLSRDELMALRRLLRERFHDKVGWHPGESNDDS